MKKYELNLKENEELIVDVDDTMETELPKFKEAIKGLKVKDIKLFNNWVKIYKLLNYDIIEGLVINKVYKFNDFAAVIELTFRGKKEYDMLHLNPQTMTVACMNVKNDSVRPYVVRRLLIPNTIEDALSFAKSALPEEGIKAVKDCLNNLKSHGDKFDVTEQIKLNEGFQINNTGEKNKEQKIKEEIKPEEPNNQINEDKQSNETLYVPKINNIRKAVFACMESDGRISAKKLISMR